MAYEVMNKAPKAVNGQILSTVIDIRQNDPYTIISREIDGDQTNTTDKRAIELVLEVVNEETTPKNEVKNSVKQLEERITSITEAFDAQKEQAKQYKESAEVLSGTVEELIALIYGEVLPKFNTNDPVPEEGTAENKEQEGDVK